MTLVGTSKGTYAMGGYDEDSRTPQLSSKRSKRRNEVFQLDCPGYQISSCQWKQVGNLQVARARHLSIALPESYDICN